MPVTDARSESLPSILGVSSPLAPRSTRKPRIAPPCASLLAQITKTCAIGELLIHVFAPEIE